MNFLERLNCAPMSSPHPDELYELMRCAPSTRRFTGEPVATELIERVLENARFAPSGGNRQGWRVIVVKEPSIRASLRDLYLTGWYEYLAMSAAGLVPGAPVTDRAAEAEALARAPEFADAAASSGPGFAEALDRAPALLLVLADLTALAAVDRDLPRYTLVGGASIYPFVWSVLLAARTEGLSGVVTTMPVRREPDVRALFGFPDSVAMASLVVLGRPVSAPRRLRRAPVDSFTWVDHYEGPPLGV
jgi:nitroreductase